MGNWKVDANISHGTIEVIPQESLAVGGTAVPDELHRLRRIYTYFAQRFQRLSSKLDRGPFSFADLMILVAEHKCSWRRLATHSESKRQRALYAFHNGDLQKRQKSNRLEF
jgi:hypothetical protein